MSSRNRNRGVCQPMVIEGVLIQSLNHALREAKSRGFSGSITTIAKRISNGATTWSELAAPLDPRGANSESHKRRIALSRAQADAAIAALDARKAEISRRQQLED